MSDVRSKTPTVEQLKRLQKAMRNAYEYPSLKEMARTELGIKLEDIVPVRGNLTEMVNELIHEYASEQGGLHKLIKAAWEGNPNNSSLSNIADELLAIDFDPWLGSKWYDSLVDWLKNLPPLPEGKLPETPFRNIQRFRQEDAPIFFGRGREIRDLYRRIIKAEGASIILFFGQSGTGKSSLLEAGLLPRLRQEQTVEYARRDQSLGLTRTMARAIGLDADADNLPPQQYLDQWRKREAEGNPPLTIFLDQVEEVYTRPRGTPAEEMGEFLDVLQEIFGAKVEPCPKGRLVLGFRKEWLADIQKRLGERELAREEVFIERLDRLGIIEAILGPAQGERLQDAYGLVVDGALAVEIADDMLADPSSPVAPMLQILLDNMWHAAKKRDLGPPEFSQDLYHELKHKGLLLSDFLDQQLQDLEDLAPKDANWVESGLALDLLKYHTTPSGTAEQHARAETEQMYAHQSETLSELLSALHNLYLLVEPAGKASGADPDSRLAHDELARVVIERFNASTARGQLARRILEGRLPRHNIGEQGSQQRVDGDKPAISVFGPETLQVVRAGKNGMRMWTVPESELVQRSQEKLDEEQQAREEAEGRRRRERLIRKIIYAFAALAVVAAVALALLQGMEALKTSRARQRTLSQFQAKSALDNLTVDPIKSVSLALAAMPNEPAADRVPGFVRTWFGTDKQPYEPAAEFALNNAVGAALERERTLITDGNPLSDIAQGASSEAHQFLSSDSKGLTFLTRDGDQLNAYSHAFDGSLQMSNTLTLPIGVEVFAAALRPSHDQSVPQVAILTDGGLLLEDFEHGVESLPKAVPARSGKSRLAWSPSGAHLAIWEPTVSGLSSGVITIVDSDNGTIEFPGPIQNVIWLEDIESGEYLLVGLEEGLWSVTADGTKEFIAPASSLDGIAPISLSEDAWITWHKDEDSYIWQRGEKIGQLAESAGAVRQALIAPNGNRLATVESDQVRVWRLRDEPAAEGAGFAVGTIYPSAILDITAMTATWHPTEPTIVTTDSGGAIRLWDAETGAQLTVAYGHRGDVNSISFVTDIFPLYWANKRDFVTTGEDGTVRTWQLLNDDQTPIHCVEQSPDTNQGVAIQCKYDQIVLPVSDTISAITSINWADDAAHLLWITDNTGALHELSLADETWKEIEYPGREQSATAFWTGEYLVTQQAVSDAGDGVAQDGAAQVTIYGTDAATGKLTARGSHPAQDILNESAIGQTLYFIYMAFADDQLWLWDLSSDEADDLFNSPKVIELSERAPNADWVDMISLADTKKPDLALTDQTNLFIIRDLLDDQSGDVAARALIPGATTQLSNPELGPNDTFFVSNSGTLILQPGSTGDQAGVIEHKGHSDTIQSAAWIMQTLWPDTFVGNDYPDSEGRSLLITAGGGDEDRTVRIWDAARIANRRDDALLEQLTVDGEILKMVVEQPSGGVNDNRRILVLTTSNPEGGAANRLVLWSPLSLHREQLIKRACALLPPLSARKQLGIGDDSLPICDN